MHFFKRLSPLLIPCLFLSFAFALFEGFWFFVIVCVFIFCAFKSVMFVECFFGVVLISEAGLSWGFFMIRTIFIWYDCVQLLRWVKRSSKEVHRSHKPLPWRTVICSDPLMEVRCTLKLWRRPQVLACSGTQGEAAQPGTSSLPSEWFCVPATPTTGPHRHEELAGFCTAVCSLLPPCIPLRDPWAYSCEVQFQMNSFFCVKKDQ